MEGKRVDACGEKFFFIISFSLSVTESPSYATRRSFDSQTQFWFAFYERHFSRSPLFTFFLNSNSA